MLVWLAEYLVRYETAFNAISYITVRAILALLTALFISLWIGPKVIKRLQILKFGQEVRNDGPESHFAKKGTPTMGGVIILYWRKYVIMGKSSESLYLGLLICIIWIRCNWLCG